MTCDEKKLRILRCLQQSSHGENCSGLHLEFFSKLMNDFAALQPACCEEIFPLEPPLRAVWDESPILTMWTVLCSFLGSNLPAGWCKGTTKSQKGFLLNILYCSTAIISLSAEHSEAMNNADKII